MGWRRRKGLWSCQAYPPPAPPALRVGPRETFHLVTQVSSTPDPNSFPAKSITNPCGLWPTFSLIPIDLIDLGALEVEARPRV